MSLVLERAPRTEEELWWATQALWNHRIPRTKVCPDHDAPFDAFATAYFERDPQILIHGSRGLAGKSRTLSILGLTKAAIKGADVNILGGSLNQSNNIHQTMRDAWDSRNAPKYLVQDDSMTLIKLRNGAKIRPLTASQKTVRGPHPPFLLLDEIDEMDQLILDAALGQPMEQKNWRGELIKAQTTMSSTWQYPDKTFAEVYRRHQDQELPIYTWCLSSGTLVLTARGEVPIEEIRRGDSVMTRKGWRPVQHLTFMGEKETITFRVGNRLLRLTPDHKIATPDGWREAGALAADAVPSVLSDPGVLNRELVSTGAMGGALLVQPGSRLVDGWGHELDVLRVHAASVPTEVIGLEYLGGRPYDSLPHPEMCIGGGSAWCVPLGYPLDAVSGAFGPRPIKAVGEHGNTLTPVWDIGVEDAHEFVAEGVVVHNCYRETSNPVDGWLNPDFIEEKKRQIPAEMWRVEYELGEPSIGNRAFDSDAVERAFSLPVEPLVKQKVGKDFMEMQWDQPRDDREYVIAADWAKAQDFTVISVLDVTHMPVRPVYWVRMRRRPYPVMIGAYNDLMKRYNAEGIHDATGLGGVVADYIDRRAYGFMMTGVQRDNMLSEYISAVENDQIRAPRVEVFYKAHLYCSTEDIYSRGKEFHLPDEVCSMALAWNLVSRRTTPAEPLVMPNTQDPNWMELEVRENHSEKRSGSWSVGAVRNKSQEAEQEFNIMV